MQLALILTIVLACALSLQAPPQLPDAWAIRLGLTAFLGIGVVGWAAAITRCATRRWIARTATGIDLSAAQHYRAGRRFHLGVQMAYVVVVYTLLDYASIVRSQTVLGRLILIDDLVILAPLILPLIGSWAMFAGAEQQISQLPVRWLGRARYAALQARYYLLLPLTPILVLLAARDVLQLASPAHWERIEAPLLCLCLVGISLGLPWLLRLIWPTQRLAVGAERQQIEALLERAGLRVADILVWQTEKQVVNAATTGVLPGCRYLLLSDGLLDRLDHGQLSAIAAHEAGHLRHRHATHLLLSLAIPLLALLVLQPLLARSGAGGAVGVSGAAFVLLFWLLIHCRIARLLEHQADVAACHLISGASRLQADAVDRYSAALQAVAEGGTGADWLHPSIGTRIALLRYLLAYDNRELDFQRHVRYVNRLLTALALLLLSGWALWL